MDPLFTLCEGTDLCTKCRLQEHDRITLTKESKSKVHVTKEDERRISGVTFTLFKEMATEFQGKVTERQRTYAREILRPQETILLCSYPGKMGILFYTTGFGKNYGTTMMYTNFGRLLQFDLYGDPGNWSVCLLENPRIPDDQMVTPLSSEHLAILSLMTYRKEFQATASYDTDLFYRLVSEFYHQNVWLGPDEMDEIPLTEPCLDRTSELSGESESQETPDKYIMVDEAQPKTDTPDKPPKKRSKFLGIW
jgi:hypothetical protein